MKPTDLDELFRSGLNDQQQAPRARAWDAIRQRLDAPETTDEAEELPAFLRNAADAAPPPMAAPVRPLMTASRGGGAAPAGNVMQWYQRPAWRAAAVAVLALGGALAAQQQYLTPTPAPAGSATVAVTEAPSASRLSKIRAAAQALAQESETVVAMAPTQPELPVNSLASAGAATNRPVAASRPSPASPPADQQAPTTASEPAAIAATSPAATALEMPAISQPQRPPREENASAPANGYALASLRVTPTLIQKHLHCQDEECTTCDRIEAKIGRAKFYQMRAEAADVLLARAGHKKPGRLEQPAAGLSALDYDGAQPAPSDAPAPGVAFASKGLPAPELVQITISRDELAQVAAELQAAAARQQRTENSRDTDRADERTEHHAIRRPSDVLRVAGDRILNIIDRADHRRDGRLTIDTEVVGRPVRKSISL